MLMGAHNLNAITLNSLKLVMYANSGTVIVRKDLTSLDSQIFTIELDLTCSCYMAKLESLVFLLFA